MMMQAARALGCAVLLAAQGQAAGAQTPRPAPSPPPAGFTGHAHANVNVVVSGTTYSGVARFAVAQRANLVRIDVLSLSSDTMPLPPITGTLVVDHGANTITLWNDTTRRYYVQPLIPRIIAGASPSPRPSASPRPRGSSPPAQRGSPFRNLELLSMSLRMTGHTTTSGLPTTGLAFDLQVQNRGDRAPTHVTANTQIADDYTAFPVTIDASVEPGAGTYSAKLAYAMDDFARGLPPAASFVVPAGYTKVSSPFRVLFASATGRPGMAPGAPSAPPSSPAPAPMATATPR